MAWRYLLVASGALAIGCDRQADPIDASPEPQPSSVTVHWTLQNAAGERQPCPTGFDTATVIVLSARGAAPIATPFPCADGSGTVRITPVPRDAYGVMVRITDGPGGNVFGESGSVAARGDVSLTVITDLGRLKVHWTLSRGGVHATCNDLGVDMVQVEVTPAQGQPMAQSTYCVLYEAPTGYLPTGTARVVVTAGTKSGSLDNVAVPTGSLFADVTPIDLAF